MGKKVVLDTNVFVSALGWGEGNFGRLIIEGSEEVDEVFGEYISEIQFKAKISAEIIRGYTEIKEKNLEDIRYGI